ncbi:MAG: ABC transporter ATP-binding protein [Anaerolineae bacterium]
MAAERRIGLSGVTYHYPGSSTAALGNVCLDFAAGEFVLVMGPSGGGKSTLLRCFNGLVPHFYGGTFSGHVNVLGRDPVALGPRHMSDIVGFVFQDPETQFIVDDVEGELAFSMEARAYPRPLMAERIAEVSRLLGIEHLLGRRVSTLSGGQRQRVAVAAALAMRPEVLVLDEPTSQLDPVAADELLNALVDLNREQGLTVFLSEHRLERVVQYVHRIAYVPGGGAEIEVGAPREILPRVPLAPAVVRLGHALHWTPPPITVEEARPLAAALPPAERGNGHDEGEQGEALLVADGVSYAYPGFQALSELSLTVRRGEILAIQGHNGAGKTTLLKALVGLLKPQQGRVLLAGREVGGLSTHDIIAQVGYVPQSPGSLLFQETVRQELEFTRHSHGLPPQDPMPLLERLGLVQYAETYPRDLSQGERQRVALAAILVAEPRALLLDEPTLGLDYLQKTALVGILHDLQRDGVAIVMATHDTELVAACADRTIVLREGHMLDEGDPGAVMLRHEAYASQIGRLFHDGSRLTVEDVLRRRPVRSDE